MKRRRNMTIDILWALKSSVLVLNDLNTRDWNETATNVELCIASWLLAKRTSEAANEQWKSNYASTWTKWRRKNWISSKIHFEAALEVNNHFALESDACIKQRDENTFKKNLLQEFSNCFPSTEATEIEFEYFLDVSSYVTSFRFAQLAACISALLSCWSSPWIKFSCFYWKWKSWKLHHELGIHL